MSILLLRARLLGADDISFGRNSIVYVNYLGITHSIAQVNASHLPFLAQAYTVEQLIDGSQVVAVYPSLVDAAGAITAGTNLSAGGTLSVTGNATLSGTLTLPSMNVAGYVKNTAAGLLTGGNTFSITISDIPAGAITGSAAYGTSATGTDAYEISLTPTLTTYATGQLIAFEADTANTGACSLDIDGVGAVAIKVRSAGTLFDPIDNDIQANCIAYVVYDSTAPAFLLLNPGGERRSRVYAAGTSGTWTCPAGVTKVYVTGCGGGGGGGGGDGAAAGNGGTASLCIVRYVMTVIPGTGYNFDVGDKGIGGNASVNGNDGEDTTFGTLTLTKGTGGLAGGGSSTGGSISLGLGGTVGNPGNPGTGSGSGGGGGSIGAAGGDGAGGLLWLEW